MHHLKEVRLLRTSSCIKRKGKWGALFEGAQIESSSEPAGSMTDQTLDGYLSKHTQLSFGSVLFTHRNTVDLITGHQHLSLAWNDGVPLPSCRLSVNYSSILFHHRSARIRMTEFLSVSPPALPSVTWQINQVLFSTFTQAALLSITLSNRVIDAEQTGKISTRWQAVVWGTCQPFH